MNMSTNEPNLTGLEPEVRNPEVAYDPTDLSARGVVLFLVFLAIGGILITAVTWGLYKYIAVAVGPNPVAGPIGASRQRLIREGADPASKFPAPRLQADPVADMNRFREREEQILNSYGWVEEADGRVHIPIERAIDLLATAGLPVRPSPEPASINQPENRGAQ
jgi:hypothetical protein